MGLFLQFKPFIMENPNNDKMNMAEVQNEDANEVKATLDVCLPKLTKLQRERKNTLVYMCGEDHAITIVQNLSSQGLNSWASTQPKFNFVYSKDAKHREYVDGLYDEFDLFTDYSFDEIIQSVTKVRQGLGLSPYTEMIQVRCIADYLNLFIVKQVTEAVINNGITQNKLVGYRGIIKIKAD